MAQPLARHLGDDMARRFLDDIRADIASRIADNDVGAIDAADVRTPLLDMMDSVITDEATLDVDTGKIDLSTTTAWATYATYDSSAGDDGDFLKINQGAGTVTGSSTAGFSYLITASMSAIFPPARAMNVSVGVNGNPVGFIAGAPGDGAGDPVTLSTTFFVRSAGSNDVFSLLWQTDQAITSNVDVPDARLTVVIWPTNNP